MNHEDIINKYNLDEDLINKYKKHTTDAMEVQDDTFENLSNLVTCRKISQFIINEITDELHLEFLIFTLLYELEKRRNHI